MRKRPDEHIQWAQSIPFFALHAACLLAIWTVVSWTAAFMCALLYFVRMFAITAGFHRYFSHRSYQTSRWFQFALAFLGTCATQKGPLWWAANHRHHHAHSDTADDAHSPRHGFWWSHVGWFLCGKYEETNYRLISDLARFPELRFLNRFYLIPPAILGTLVFAVGKLLATAAPGLKTSGPQMLIWGFFISTVLLYHGTFLVNSLAHVIGRRRFPTKDDSRNSLLIALVTLGEGWHNNHHYAPSSERQGFYWWEVDVSHYVLTGLSWLGVVWHLKRPPQLVYAAESPAAKRAERAA